MWRPILRPSRIDHIRADLPTRLKLSIKDLELIGNAARCLLASKDSSTLVDIDLGERFRGPSDRQSASPRRHVVRSGRSGHRYPPHRSNRTGTDSAQIH